MDTYIITAKTVEVAYAEANAKYADENHEVSCEVIEMPKKGFLGLGAKDAKIKVTVTSSASAELGSIVSDMKKMKKYTDRGGDGQEKSQPKPENKPQQKPEQPQSGKKQNNQNNNQKNNRNGDRRGNDGQRNADGQKNGDGKKQQNNQPKKDDRPAQPKTGAAKPEEKQNKEQKQRSALHNGAKPNTRQQIKHTPGEEVEGASVTVGTPMGLTDFVSEKKGGFGSSERSGGSMSNDIRRKKPAKPMVSADKADEKMRQSKYDMAESDDDYKNIESMISEDEAALENEARSALGFTDTDAKEEALPAPEPRKREPITQQEMDYALEFANMLLSDLNLSAKAVQCECPEGEEFEPVGDANVYPRIEITGDDTGILIGHHGETLDAIQYLVNLSSLRKSKSKDGDYVKIVVDIENYRNKREATLKALARRMAAKAVKYKRNVFLEPMNAYERRIIHSELQSYPDVSTHSVGADRDRKIIITYEGADKQTEQRNRRRRGGQRQQKSGEKTVLPTVASENGAENAERRRPRKIQKVSIDKIGDILDGDKTLLDGAGVNQSEE